MGLFSHKEQVNPDGTVSNHHHTKADAALAGAAAHHESNQHPGRNGVLAAGGVGEVQHHRNHNHDHVATHGTHGTTGAGYGTAAGAGTGVGYGSAGATNTGPAPLSANGGTGNHRQTEREATKLEKKGEMQTKIGNALHSTSMQDKGAAKLAQADHLHMQASELSEAQRLEHEAGLRRQRAVGLGAHPSHASGTTGHGPTL